MNSILIVFTLRLSSFLINDCICSCNDLKEQQQSSYESSELIFIGQVLEVNEDLSYRFKTIEVFKGNLSDSVIVGRPFGYCEVIPRKEDISLNWIVYANPDSEGIISMDECGLSRSFRRPYLLCKEASVPPPPDKRLGEEWGDLKSEFKRLEYQKRALEVLRGEIQQLRQWRDN